MGLVGEQSENNVAARYLSASVYGYALVSGENCRLERNSWKKKKKLARELSRYYETVAPPATDYLRNVFFNRNFVSL